MPEKILGLDIGTNSIGWSLMEQEREPENGKDGVGRIIAAGARVFTAPVEDKTEVPKNRERRAKRGGRRILARRRMRREYLITLLEGIGALPKGREEREKLLRDVDPYAVRARGLDESLTLQEFGRALFHMSERRGFRSNRKGGKDKKEEGKALGSIKTLREEMEKKGMRTLGEYLFSLKGNTLRKRFTHRDMYGSEYDLLWKSQSKHHLQLTDDLKIKIWKAIFHQRPLKTVKHLVGFCDLERKIWKTPEGRMIDKGPKRASKSHPVAQRFRTLQDITNIKVNGLPLKKDQIGKILGAIDGKASLTWKALKKAAVLDPDTRLNMEETGKKNLPGAYTLSALEKALGKAKWNSLSPEKRDALYTDLQTIENESAFQKRLTGPAWGFNPEEAEELAKVELEDGYAALSLKAIKKLIPHMEAGKSYPEAKLLAGYGQVTGASAGAPVLGEPPQVRNPVVQKALYETRKVVNAIIGKHGMPDIIRVELARDAKQPKRVKDDRLNEIRAREAENEEINEKLIKEFGLPSPTRDDREKYRLWQECNEQSAYSNRPISKSQLFSPEVQVEHILPWRRSLDNSYMNKTLCFQDENLAKGDQTPKEAWGQDEQKWGEIMARIKSLPMPKIRRFHMDDIASATEKGQLSKFLDSQLTDTRYITKEVCGYLKTLGVRVDSNKGLFTAWLRGEWGLYNILPKRNFDLTSGKDRSDHRHHALDAVVIALAGPWMVNVLSRATSRGTGSMRYANFPAPWPGFRQEVADAMEKIIVSHRASRKIRGALHEETSYGPTSETGKFVRRKAIASLSASEIDDIRDPIIQKMIQDRIIAHGGEMEKAIKTDFILGKNPVKKVRLNVTMRPDTVFPIKDETGKVYRYVTFGNNHHIEILKNKKTGKHKGEVVTMMEAAARARKRKEPVIKKDHGPDWEFVMSLSINEMVKIPMNGKEEFYRVQVISSSSPMLTLRHYYSADIKDNTTRLLKNPGTLMETGAQKVTLSPIGEVYPAHD